VFLIDFINAALLFEGDDRIVDLEVIPGEIHAEDSKIKLSVLDASAKLADGRTVDCEIQIVNYHDFRKRGPYYWAKRHARKLEKGKATFLQIKSTITICLLAFDLLEEEDAYRNSYSIRNDKSGNRLCADMQLIYLELPKFLTYLGADHPRTGLERWLLYFCNEEGKRMEKVMAEDSVLSMAKEVELAFWADEEERERYFQHQQLLMDAYSAEHSHEVLLEWEKEKVEKAEKKAEQAEERAEQEKKRAEQAEERAEQTELAALKMARDLLKLGMDMEQVVKKSGLSKEKIRGNMLD
jgi:predicted transposase/invertase (TIGR01784 family)